MTVEVGAVPARVRPFFFALFLSLPPEITPSRFLKGGIARHSANMDKGGGLEFDLQ